MGLQKAQRPQDAKGHFLSACMQRLILMQEAEESTSSTLDPKRVEDKMCSGQTWKAAYVQCCLLPQETQRLGVTPWVGNANMALVLLNEEKWNCIGPKAGSSSCLQSLLIESTRLWSFGCHTGCILCSSLVHWLKIGIHRFSWET